MLSNLTRKVQRSGNPQQNSSDPKNRLPVLPVSRTCPISPPKSAVNSSSTSAFFTHLPFDIRREILIHAFGAQIIHIDLVYGRPRITGKNASTKSHRFRRAPRPTAAQLRATPALHRLRSKQWQWYSSICHSSLPQSTQSWSRFAEPCDDSCSGAGHCCSEWPGQAPSKCSVGVVGWLLACRQAYVEGMDVLWGTNTLRIEDMIILRHAQDLFLPYCWVTVPRLELQWIFSYSWVWPSAHPDTEPPPPYADETSFHSLLDHLPSVLNSLQTLHISLQSTSKWDPDRPPTAVIDKVLKPVEGMLRQLPSTLLDCTVAIPSSVYRISRDEAVLAERTVEHSHKQQKERHWRELHGPADGLKGYWVQLGKIDMGLPIAWPCFGSGGNWSWRDDFDIPDEDCILYGMRA